MMTQAIPLYGFLDQFEDWGNRKRKALLVDFSLEKARRLDEKADQSTLSCEDCRRYVQASLNELKNEVALLAQSVATLVLASFAACIELFRVCSGSIQGSICLRNICLIPKHIIISIVKMALVPLKAIYQVANAIKTGVGFLAWHGSEWVVRVVKRGSTTILSNDHRVRDIVYQSIGVTLLAAGAIFIPLAAIQMLALPIILGSIYGAINNQFTVRECPEYYTMGHYYDGTNLKGHAVKTNHLLIKPIITGCYATTMVTQVAGIILAAVGTLPYTAAILSVPYAAAMIGIVCLVSLVIAHVFSTMQKSGAEKSLGAYAALIGIQWTENDHNKTWGELAEVHNRHIERKRQLLKSNMQNLERFNQRLQELTEYIELNLLDHNLPIKHIASWQANHTRNMMGYFFAAGGSLAVAISTVFLRIFAL